MYKNILIATDGSELAAKGVTHGLQLAKALNAGVVFVTTTEIWPVLEMAAAAERGVPEPAEAFEAQAAKAAEEVLSQAEASAKECGVPCETVHVRDQYPAEGIIDTANSKNCDLIVIASHGRRGIGRAILGSVANEVITHSEVPVVVVR